MQDACRVVQRRGSGLNLLVAAIILWNTNYLQRALDTFESKGTIRRPEILPICRP
jgi:TnpA family transposase